MNTQEKLDKLEQKLALLMDAMENEKTVGEMIYHSTLFEVYMERRQELKNQLEK